MHQDRPFLGERQSQTSQFPGFQPRVRAQEAGESWGPVTAGGSVWPEGALGSPSPLAPVITKHLRSGGCAPLRTPRWSSGRERGLRRTRPEQQTRLWSPALTTLKVKVKQVSLVQAFQIMSSLELKQQLLFWCDTNQICSTIFLIEDPWDSN